MKNEQGLVECVRINLVNLVREGIVLEGSPRAKSLGKFGLFWV